MNTLLTILLHTHEREAFLERALAYYTAFGVRVVVLDSSRQSNAGLVAPHPGVDYRHCPELDFRAKLAMGVNLVDTPYMVFAPEDDFVVPGGFEDAVAFLEAHRDYGVCRGYDLMYLAEAQKVHYFLRDRRVQSDFGSDAPAQRVRDFMSNYLPPWYAVARTALMRDWYACMPHDTGVEFQEFGQAFYLLARAKARILDRAYTIRELNYPVSDHGTDLLAAMEWSGGADGERKAAFFAFMQQTLAAAGIDAGQARDLPATASQLLAQCLRSRHSLTLKELFHSQWRTFAATPDWRFEPEQHVEMPFYTEAFFRALAIIDLLVRVCPAGKLQRIQLREALEAKQALLGELAAGGNATTLRPRLEAAFKANPFDREIAAQLAGVSADPGLDGWQRFLSAATAVPAQFKQLAGDGDPGTALAPLPRGLPAWLRARVPSLAQAELLGARLAEHAGGPALAVFVRARPGQAQEVAATLRSLAALQPPYAPREIHVLADAAPEPQPGLPQLRHVAATTPAAQAQAINALTATGSCSWLLCVEAGDVFTASGLLLVAQALLSSPEMRAVYADHMVRTGNGGVAASFRPDFNLDLLLSLPAVMARHWLFRRDVFLRCGGLDPERAEAAEFDLLLRMLEQGGTDGLGHVAEPLLITDIPPMATHAGELAALQRHLGERGYADATLSAPHPGCYRIRYGHAARPRVSIIVPTRNQLPMLRRCVESLLEKTSYPHYEVLIVDNGSDEADAVAWLHGIEAMDSPQLRVLRYPYPFNYSAMNNLAAQAASGEYLVLLNNDTAILQADWLDALLNHAQRPEVGIVGAKLLYPDGHIQHAGVVLGLRGPAEHPFLRESINAAGYMYRLQVDQDYTAVTGACLMVRKALYEEVGGLDEAAFKVSYNDVDLCLKVRSAGYLVVWTPHALLLHEGSVSQTQVDTAAQEAKRKRFQGEQDALYDRWLPTIARDPAYNRNLSLEGAGFTLEKQLQLNWHPLDAWRPLPVVVALAADQQGCGQYRVIQPVQAMNEFGVADAEWSHRYYSPVELERRSPDVVVLQRQMFEDRIEPQQRLARFSRAFRVAELDDYLPLLPRKSVHHGKLPKDVLRTMRETLKLVDRFVVSTAPLAEALDGLHHDIRVVENHLPLPWWQQAKATRRGGAKLRVGWGGGAGHRGDLELIADVVRALADEVEWVFFGMCPEALRPHVHEYHPPVAIEEYPAKLAALDLDLALAPLEDNLFNRCKSNLRLLEYGACGFPVVCSDIAPYQGNLPVTRVKPRFRDWVDAIRMHAAERDATAAAGDALRAAVQRDWMLDQKHAAFWLSQWMPD